MNSYVPKPTGLWLPPSHYAATVNQQGPGLAPYQSHVACRSQLTHTGPLAPNVNNQDSINYLQVADLQQQFGEASSFSGGSQAVLGNAQSYRQQNLGQLSPDVQYDHLPAFMPGMLDVSENDSANHLQWTNLQEMANDDMFFSRNFSAAGQPLPVASQSQQQGQSFPAPNLLQMWGNPLPPTPEEWSPDAQWVPAPGVVLQQQVAANSKQLGCSWPQLCDAGPEWRSTVAPVPVRRGRGRPRGPNAPDRNAPKRAVGRPKGIKDSYTRLHRGQKAAMSKEDYKRERAARKREVGKAEAQRAGVLKFSADLA